jgi:hypothetical protein
MLRLQDRYVTGLARVMTDYTFKLCRVTESCLTAVLDIESHFSHHEYLLNLACYFAMYHTQTFKRLSIFTVDCT